MFCFYFQGEAEDMLKEIKFPNLTILQPGWVSGST